MIGFGERLKSLRLNSKMTQAQLADRLGVTKSVISAYETGIRYPTYPVLIKISYIFRTTTDYLLGVENNLQVDFSGLSDKQRKAIIDLIDSIRMGDE